MASKSRVLYVGITNDIRRRVWEHKNNVTPGFTSKYRVHRLVYFVMFKYVGNRDRPGEALKGWLRDKKVALIRAANPTWEDLREGWFEVTALGPMGARAKSRSFAALRMTSSKKVRCI